MKKSPVEYLHPGLSEILANTHGIVLFQEQITAMFQKFCGYSAERADEIREFIGKKKVDEMNKILPEMRERLEEGGWNNQQISAFVSLCRAASSYSFNLSHSVAYAYMGYVCMWLKAHYPLEWWTAILQNSTHEDLEKNAKYFSKIIHHPDINISDLDFYIIDDEKQKIVYPLSMVKGVKSAASFIMEKKPFVSMKDFYDRVEKRKVNKRVVNALIWAGAFDTMPEAEDGDKATKRNKLYRAYISLRGEAQPEEDFSLGKVDMLESGSLCIGSPNLVEYFRSNGSKNCIDIPTALSKRIGAGVVIPGIVSEIKKVTTKKGDLMAFMDVSCGEHQISITLFPDVYEQHKAQLKKDVVALIQGKTNEYNSRKSIIAERISFIDIDNIN